MTKAALQAMAPTMSEQSVGRAIDDLYCNLLYGPAQPWSGAIPSGYRELSHHPAVLVLQNMAVVHVGCLGRGLEVESYQYF